MVDPEARSAVNALRKEMTKISSMVQHQQAAEELRRQEQKKKEVIDQIVEVQGRLFERASAYANLMLVGGFAGAFTVWSNTKDILPRVANVSIGFALGLSLAVFVFFEVYKMVVTTKSVNRSVRLTRLTSDPQNFFKELEVFIDNETKPSLSFMTVWICVMLISVSSGLVACGLLFYNYMAFLAGWPQWPS